MAIKAFVFDCGGVLLRNDDLSAYRAWEQRLGLEQGALAERLWQGETWRLAELGKISEDEFWRRAGDMLGLQDPGERDALRQDLWDSWSLDTQVLDVIDTIRRRYPVAILSNATDALEGMLSERYQVAERFAAILNSARLGVAKPDEAIFQIMLKRLKAEPGEIVFIDDRAENVAAAAALGMHVVWFVHANELQRQLAVYLRNGHSPAKAVTLVESAVVDDLADED
jgi:putative hydrolase of the HAD superfamily